jgi:hypothetical protein
MPFFSEYSLFIFIAKIAKVEMGKDFSVLRGLLYCRGVRQKFQPLKDFSSAHKITALYKRFMLSENYRVSVFVLLLGELKEGNPSYFCSGSFIVRLVFL